MDFSKITSELGDLFTNYFNVFISILTSPKNAILSLLTADNERDKENSDNSKIKKTFIYTLISIGIGVAMGSLMGLPHTPNSTNFSTLIAVLFIWILIALILHPLLILFNGKGKIKETIAVFLFIVSTTHIIWIPAIAIISNVIVQTRVYLTYDYVISFGSSRGDEWGGRAIPNYVESYIKGKSPEKENTILPPIDSTKLLKNNSQNSIERQRVLIDSTKIKPPKRTEKIELKEDSYGWLFLVSFLYYLSNCIYLAWGLSIPHQISSKKLFILSIVGPITVIIFMIIIFFLCLMIF